MFIEYGANTNIVTNQGLSAMHLAAQGDQLSVLAYLNENGFSTVMYDNKGATPLHWSAYLGCELATSVLLSMNADVDAADRDSQTPLHMACISGNARIVRNLLLKGAQPDKPDRQGRTPMSIAIENGFSSIIQLLKPPGILSLCGIKPPQRPVKNRRLLLILYCILFCLGVSSSMLWVGVYYEYYLLLCSIELGFIILACNKDPGYVKKHQGTLLVTYI